MRAFRFSLFVVALGIAPSALASFHAMQIEQAIGGVDGDTAQQAIQLRMRSGSQGVLSLTRLKAFNASGAGEVLLVDMGSDVSNDGIGSRILIATQAFATAQGITPDFVMTNPIPPSYLAAGRITFEQDPPGPIYWSLSWGGAGYTGSTSGSTFNDSNGDFGPSEDVALPSTDLTALRFTGSAGAASTNNLANYDVTAGAATFTNNAGASIVVTAPVDETVFNDGFESPP
jgi:hypothetical protein